MQTSKNILITGASTGIGYDLCKEFLKRGYTVFGSVRKKSDATRLEENLGNQFQALIFDVTNRTSVEGAANELSQKVGTDGLGGLVNNAGVAVAGPLIDLSVDDYRYQFEVNVFGAIHVTQCFLPLLGTRKDHERKPGKILQMSSVAGKVGMPFMSAYSGSKHALEGITHSLRKELIRYGIDVIILGPGPIKTPIWNKGMGEEAQARYQQSVYYAALDRFQKVFVSKAVENAWTSEKAAIKMVNIFEKDKPKTRYSLVSQRWKNWIIPNLLPDRFIDKFIAGALKIKQ